MTNRARRGVVLLAALYGACSESRAAPPSAPQAVPVRLSEVLARPIENATDYVARMDSRRSVELQPQVGGVVTRVLVQSGDVVKIGTPVLEIDPRQQRASLSSAEEQGRSAEVNLSLARQQYDRTLALFQDQAVSQQELDQARANYQAAQAAAAAQSSRVKNERLLLHYHTVTAPFEGVVGDIPARTGDLVTPSTVLTTIDQVQRLQVYVYVPGERAGEVKTGLPVRIVDEVGGMIDSGQVDFVSPRVERDTQTVLVKATIPNEKGVLRQAQSVRARIVFSTAEKLVVPVTAVLRLGDQTFVYVAEPIGGGQVARRRAIQTASIAGPDYVVENGLQAHEKVVASGIQKITDGTPVRPEG